MLISSLSVNPVCRKKLETLGLADIIVNKEQQSACIYRWFNLEEDNERNETRRQTIPGRYCSVFMLKKKIHRNEEGALRRGATAQISTIFSADFNIQLKKHFLLFFYKLQHSTRNSFLNRMSNP